MGSFLNALWSGAKAVGRGAKNTIDYIGVDNIIAGGSAYYQHQQQKEANEQNRQDMQKYYDEQKAIAEKQLELTRANQVKYGDPNSKSALANRERALRQGIRNRRTRTNTAFDDDNLG